MAVGTVEAALHVGDDRAPAPRMGSPGSLGGRRRGGRRGPPGPRRAGCWRAARGRPAPGSRRGRRGGPSPWRPFAPCVGAGCVVDSSGAGADGVGCEGGVGRLVVGEELPPASLTESGSSRNCSYISSTSHALAPNSDPSIGGSHDFQGTGPATGAWAQNRRRRVLQSLCGSLEFASGDISSQLPGGSGLNIPSTEKIRNVVAASATAGAARPRSPRRCSSEPASLPRAGRVEDGTTVVRHRARGDQADDLHVARRRPVRVDGDRRRDLQGQPARLARATPTSSARSTPRCPSPTSPWSSSARSTASRSAPSGWARCAAAGLPRMVFVNKEDKQRADFHGVLDQLRAAFGHGFVPLELPLGEEDALHGVADVLTEEAFDYEPDGTHHTAPLPDRRRRRGAPPARRARRGDRLRRRRPARALPVRRGARRRPSWSARSPTRCSTGSSSRCSSARRSPASASTGSPTSSARSARRRPTARRPSSPARRGGTSTSRPTPAAKPLVYVFKTIADPFVGQVSVFKVLSGTVRVDDRLVNTPTGTEERLHGLFHLRGKEHLPTDEVVAGDIAAVAKLADTTTGDTLAPEGHAGARRRHRRRRRRCTAWRSKPRHPGRRRQALRRAAPPAGRGPGPRVDRIEETKQTVLRGAGDTHLAVALERLARKFGVHVETEDVRVPYRETIVGTGRGRGQGQEAVRRPRAVRRGQPARQPAAARRRVRVRRLDRRRGDPAQLHPRRAEGHRGGDGHRRRARLPRRRRPRRVLRRQVPLRRLLRHGVQDAAAAQGFKEALAAGRRRRCSSRSRCSRSRCRRATRAT